MPKEVEPLTVTDNRALSELYSLATTIIWSALTGVDSTIVIDPPAVDVPNLAPLVPA